MHSVPFLWLTWFFIPFSHSTHFTDFPFYLHTMYIWCAISIDLLFMGTYITLCLSLFLIALWNILPEIKEKSVEYQEVDTQCAERDLNKTAKQSIWDLHKIKVHTSEALNMFWMKSYIERQLSLFCACWPNLLSYLAGGFYPLRSHYKHILNSLRM